MGLKIFSVVCLPHLHNIVSNMLPNKMLSKCHGFLFRVISVLVVFNITLVLYKNIGVGLDNLIHIYLRWYRRITNTSTAFFSAVNSELDFEVCTAVWRFDDHVVGVDPTTENNQVIDLPVTFSCPRL